MRQDFSEEFAMAQKFLPDFFEKLQRAFPGSLPAIMFTRAFKGDQGDGG